MPAPTAPLKSSTETPADTVPSPTPAQDEELLLDAPEAVPSDPNTFQPPSFSSAEDAEMVVDEEGRPRFAPGKDTVSSTPRVRSRTVTTTNLLFPPPSRKPSANPT